MACSFGTRPNVSVSEWTVPPWGTGSPPAGDQKTTEIATFDPAAPPYERPRPGEAMGSYETVMAMHQNINSQINTIANANPAIYALMATGNTDALVGADLTEVRAALTAGLLKVLDNITKTTAASNSQDLGWQDLQPVHQRLFESDPTYQKPFEQAAARGYVEEESGNADNASTLMTVAVIGLTASTATAADSWQQWSKLETAAQSTVSDSTAVVSKDQVDAASLKAIVDTAFALLDVFGLGKAARSAASVAKVASFEASLAVRTAMRGLAALSAAERLTVLRKAIEERGIAAVLRETGQTAKELIELVGEQSDVGRQLLTFAAAGARGAEEIATKLPVLKTLAGTEAAAVVESAIDLIGQPKPCAGQAAGPESPPPSRPRPLPCNGSTTGAVWSHARPRPHSRRPVRWHPTWRREPPAASWRNAAAWPRVPWRCCWAWRSRCWPTSSAVPTAAASRWAACRRRSTSTPSNATTSSCRCSVFPRPAPPPRRCPGSPATPSSSSPNRPSSRVSSATTASRRCRSSCPGTTTARVGAWTGSASPWTVPGYGSTRSR